MERSTILVVGATGGSGREAVRALLAAGHEVVAFARSPERVALEHPRLRVVKGDAMRVDDLVRAMDGVDAVVVTLGISESAVRVRLFGSKGTPLDVRSSGTARVIEAMRARGVRKLVVQTSYGVGETRARLPRVERFVFDHLLKPQIADTERQEALVRASGLDWVLVQPVNLTDARDEGEAFASPQGETRSMKVSRARVGRFLADAAARDTYLHRSVALSS